MHRIGKLFRIDFASGLPLPRVVVGFESEKKRFEARSHHQPRDLRRDEACVQRVRRVKRDAKILPQYRIEKWKKDTVGCVQQRVIVKRDVARTDALEIPNLFDAGVKGTSHEAGIHDWNRAIRAAERTTLRDLDDADLGIDALPQRKTIGD